MHIRGAWFEQLSKERKAKLIKKADLLLGATTHVYKRYEILGNKKEKVALALNTGAVSNSHDSGFVQVHVLKNPMRLVVQYQRTSNDTRELQQDNFAFEKKIKGKIKKIDWDNF